MAFVKTICSAMERIAPLRLAESWDNVGLLLEAPIPKPGNKVLLTIDLTPPVVQEALDSQASVIVSYHPPIFRPLSSITCSKPLQSSLLRCVQAGISVYSPHTAMDSVNGGINDWLALAFSGDGSQNGTTSYITDKNDTEGGAGRLLTISDPGISMKDAVAKVKKHLNLQHVQVGLPHDPKASERQAKTVAICAGAGGSMFGSVEADILFTGEMAHHEVLAANAKNQFVILCGHTNTERGYLEHLSEKLRSAISSEDPSVGDVEVIVSKKDRHPLDIV